MNALRKTTPATSSICSLWKRFHNLRKCQIFWITGSRDIQLRTYLGSKRQL